MARTKEELREALTRSRAGQSRWRCPMPLREEIIEYSKARREAGIAVMRIARELGVSESGLARWLQDEPGTGPLRRVRIQHAPSEAVAPLVLVTPGGYRLEGLSVASAADVLRRLGC